MHYFSGLLVILGRELIIIFKLFIAAGMTDASHRNAFPANYFQLRKILRATRKFGISKCQPA
jgi:hypothetical protein